MDINFTPFFKKYEEVLAMADGAFERVKKEYSESVKCKTGCSACCYALFDLALIEALYINYHFKKAFKGKEKNELIDKSNVADREVHRIKKKASEDLKTGKKEDEILTEIAMAHIRCPLLNEEDKCSFYEYRPITCRLYGIPQSIGGVGHTCGKSGFVEGKQYPTVKLDIIQNKLYEISSEFVKEIKSGYTKLGDMLVPLSMAILTDYSEEYLGITDKEDSAKEKEEIVND